MMRDFDGPEEFLESLRDADIIRKKQSLLYVQALKFIQTKSPRRRARHVPGRDNGRTPLEKSDATRKDSARNRGIRAPGCRPPTTRFARSTWSGRSARSTRWRTRSRSATLCPRGNLMPVLGSGHPQADVMLLKYAPLPSEIEEGVAFYGRSGTALMKSFKRLGIDPLVVYGTLFVKCPVPDTDDCRRPSAARASPRRSRSCSRASSS